MLAISFAVASVLVLIFALFALALAEPVGQRSRDAALTATRARLRRSNCANVIVLSGCSTMKLFELLFLMLLLTIALLGLLIIALLGLPTCTLLGLLVMLPPRAWGILVM